MHPNIDPTTAGTWIYPTNYPIRPYQREIVETCLFSNTLVCLPTGLGKTLIAAVVMYNFYRWFPQGKIVFMAPTRPLVSQQISACRDIMGISSEYVARFDGVAVAAREIQWAEKRVFFCTPQVFENDLESEKVNRLDVVCVVFDEAHRATGNYSYVKVIQQMTKHSTNTHFRVLALSATPGSDARGIQKVVYNLLISKVEWKCEGDTDLAPYVHEKEIELVYCNSGNRSNTSNNGLPNGYGQTGPRKNISVVDSFRLQINEIVQQIAHTLVRGNYLMSYDATTINLLVLDECERALMDQKRLSLSSSSSPDLTASDSQGNNIQTIQEYIHCVELLVVLIKARQILSQEVTPHAVLSYLETNLVLRYHSQRPANKVEKKLFSNAAFISFVSDLQKLTVVVGNGYLSEVNSKTLKLVEILTEHFRLKNLTFDGNDGGRAIVFVALRTTVSNILAELSHVKEIRANQFIGQAVSKKACSGGTGDVSKGQTQKEQEDIIKRFRSGEINVLIATCIAEEGLDIGEVDLIVSYDAVSSPIRQVQRMGRTGRKSNGRVVMLIDDDKDKEKILKSNDSMNIVQNSLRKSSNSLVLYKASPRMIPQQISPVITMKFMGNNDNHAIDTGASIVPKPLRKRKMNQNDQITTSSHRSKPDTIEVEPPRSDNLGSKMMMRQFLDGQRHSTIKKANNSDGSNTPKNVFSSHNIQANTLKSFSFSSEKNVDNAFYDFEDSMQQRNLNDKEVEYDEEDYSMSGRNHSCVSCVCQVCGVDVNNDTLLCMICKSAMDESLEIMNVESSVIDDNDNNYESGLNGLAKFKDDDIESDDCYQSDRDKSRVSLTVENEAIGVAEPIDPEIENVMHSLDERYCPYLLVDIAKNGVRFQKPPSNADKCKSVIQCLYRHSKFTHAVNNEQASSGYITTAWEKKIWGDIFFPGVLENIHKIHTLSSNNQRDHEDISFVLHADSPKFESEFSIHANAFEGESEGEGDLYATSNDNFDSSCVNKRVLNHQSDVSPNGVNHSFDISHINNKDSSKITQEQIRINPSALNSDSEYEEVDSFEDPFPPKHYLNLNDGVIEKTNPCFSSDINTSKVLDHETSYFQIATSAFMSDDESCGGSDEDNIYSEGDKFEMEKKSHVFAGNLCPVATKENIIFLHTPTPPLLNDKVVLRNGVVIDIGCNPFDSHNSAQHSSTSKHFPLSHKVTCNEFEEKDDVDSDVSLSDVPCAICSRIDCNDDDPGVFCDGPCGSFMHLECYGLSRIPQTDTFYCESCSFLRSYPEIGSQIQCEICEKGDGVVRKTPNGNWCHPMCALFTPSIGLNSLKFPRGKKPGSLQNSIKCGICQRKGNAVKCAFPFCQTAMHPYCSFINNSQMIIAERLGDRVYMLCCDKHSSWRDKAINIIWCSKLDNCDKISSHNASPITPSLTLMDTPSTIEKKKKKFAYGLNLKKMGRLRKANDRIGVNTKLSKSLMKVPQGKAAAVEKKIPKDVRTFFDDEAGISESDSGDEDVSRDESGLDDSFINNGSYTPTPTGLDCGVTMYHRLHRQQEISPDISEIIRNGFRVAGGIANRHKKKMDDVKVDEDRVHRDLHKLFTPKASPSSSLDYCNS